MEPKAMREKANQFQDNKIYTTTIRLPSDLRNEVKTVLEGGVFGSFNELLVASLQSFLKALRDKAMDQEFARMADDENYQKVAINLYNLFENSALEEQGKAAGQSIGEIDDAVSKQLNRTALLSNTLAAIKVRG